MLSDFNLSIAILIVGLCFFFKYATLAFHSSLSELKLNAGIEFSDQVSTLLQQGAGLQPCFGRENAFEGSVDTCCSEELLTNERKYGVTIWP